MNDSQRSIRARLLSSLALSCAVLLSPAPALARGGNLYAGIGVGPYVYFATDDWGDIGVHVRPQLEFGIHFSNDDRGFFLAFEALPTVGEDFIMFAVGARLGGDIQIWGDRDVGVMIRPSFLFGGGVIDWDRRGCECSWGILLFQPAFDFRFALADRIVQLWARPLAFDIVLYPDNYNRRTEVDAGYMAQAGIDFAF